MEETLNWARLLFFFLSHAVYRTLSNPLLPLSFPTILTPRSSIPVSLSTATLRAKQAFSGPHAFIFRCNWKSLIQQPHSFERLVIRRRYVPVCTNTVPKIYPNFFSGSYRCQLLFSVVSVAVCFGFYLFSSKLNLKYGSQIVPEVYRVRHECLVPADNISSLLRIYVFRYFCDISVSDGNPTQQCEV